MGKLAVKNRLAKLRNLLNDIEQGVNNNHLTEALLLTEKIDGVGDDIYRAIWRMCKDAKM